jgi:deoxyribodipyrimidine photolyase-related protein
VSHFTRELHRRLPASAGDRSWLFVPYDQLSDRIGPLAREDPATLGVVVVENPAKAALRPYHRAKLALVLANLRHFALEQAERGVAVRHVVAEGTYASALRPLAQTLGPLRLMGPAERELREDLRPLFDDGSLVVEPHEGWLTTPAQFAASNPRPPYRMDRFYRRVRRDTGILMEGGRPVGGRLSFDAENRRPWRGEPPAPAVPRFVPDEITREVGALIERHFPRHPGTLELETIPATAADAERSWRWALDECLEWFGPFEDAMSTRSENLFHTRISSLLNLHRLLPRRVIADVLARPEIPLSSREGFVRQVIGWREFVRHVHRATDGFRDVPGIDVEVAPRPGDGGYAGWSGAAWAGNDSTAGDEDAAGHPTGPAADGGAVLDALGGEAPVPPAFWGQRSGLACLDQVVEGVWRDGTGHHITRLMVLGNLARLLDISPRGLTDWFWAAYRDAYDWVVEPNVLGMATFAAGDLMVTKPYVAGGAYIDRMSDFCGGCAFDVRTNCPVTRLYWAFLERHRERLDGNPRMAIPLRSLERRSAEKRDLDHRTFDAVREALGRGETLTPAMLPGTRSTEPGGQLSISLEGVGDSS